MSAKAPAGSPITLVSLHEIARRLDVSYSTLRRMMQNDTRSPQVGYLGGQARVRQDEAERWIEAIAAEAFAKATPERFVKRAAEMTRGRKARRAKAQGETQESARRPGAAAE